MRSLAPRTSTALSRGALLVLSVSPGFACIAGAPDDPALAGPSPQPMGASLGSPTIIYIPCGEDRNDELVARTSTESASALGSSGDSDVVFVCEDVCVPGTKRACYTGSAGTEGVGICHAGIETCYDDGGGYGPCLGQVTPQPEDCSTPADESCDGVASCAQSDIEWAVSLTGSVWARAVDLDAAGNGFAAGTFIDNATLVGAFQPNDSYENGFVLKHDPSGALLWLHTFDSTSRTYVMDAAVDPAGNVIIGGHFYGHVNHSGGVASATAGASDRESFVAKYSPSGALLWFQTIGGALADELISLGVDGHGDTVLFMRTASTTVTASGTSYNLPGTGTRGMFAKLDAAGQAVWMGPGPRGIEDLVVDASGAIFVAGNISGTTDLGAGPMVSNGSADAYVAKYDASGAIVWSRHAGGTGQDVARAVAVDPAGNVFVGGFFRETMDWGSGPVSTSGFNTDAFVAKLDPSGGALWARSYGNVESSQYVKEIDVDAAGNATVGFDNKGDVDYGTGPLRGGIVLVTFSPSGTATWVQHTVGTWVEVVTGLAVGNGKVLLGGNSPYAPFDPGTGMLPIGGFLAQYQP